MTGQDASEVVPWLTSAATVVALQHWLKTQPIYWAIVRAIPGADKWAHWLIAGVASLIAAAGIHLTWNWDVIKGGQFQGTLPSLPDILHGLGDWYKVYILQWTIYRTHNAATADPPPTAIGTAGKGV